MTNSKFNGFGKMYCNDILFYWGEFKDNKFEGWGVTDNYEGEWRDGKYDGYGIYKQYTDIMKKDFVSFYYEGYFQNGFYSGTGVQIKNGIIPI